MISLVQQVLLEFGRKVRQSDAGLRGKAMGKRGKRKLSNKENHSELGDRARG